MNCVVCKKGSTRAGRATLTLDKAQTVVVIRDIPAEVCTTCGEEYIDAGTMRDLERLVSMAQKAGLRIAVHQPVQGRVS